jgi:energy-coupling factor transport system ATP-binding protein
MEDVAKYVERIIVMDHGSVRYDDSPREIFRHYRELEQIGLAAPEVTYLMYELIEKGYPLQPAITVEEAKRELLDYFARN